MADLNILFSKVAKGKMVDFCIDITFVTDRGYDSNDNLLNFILNGFMMRSKLNTKWVRDIAIESLKDIHNDNNYNEFSKQYR